jgi:two-component system sensor histidine kinase KdpD
MADPERSWTSIDELIRSAADEVGSDAEDFEISVDQETPLVDADAAQLERALVNLLENARRYSAGHPVKVRAGAVGHRVMVRIVDRGPGIPQADLDRIFEPFYRGRGGGERSGAGLGLSIARGFVEANGGHLSVESLPGQGTTFVIQLPLPAVAPQTKTAGERQA